MAGAAGQAQVSMIQTPTRPQGARKKIWSGDETRLRSSRVLKHGNYGYVKPSLLLPKPIDQSLCRYGDAVQLLRDEEVLHMEKTLALPGHRRKGVRASQTVPNVTVLCLIPRP